MTNALFVCPNGEAYYAQVGNVIAPIAQILELRKEAGCPPPDWGEFERWQCRCCDWTGFRMQRRMREAEAILNRFAKSGSLPDGESGLP